MLNPEFKILEHNGKKFAYHYSLMTAEQSEIIREIAEFKAMQDEVAAEDVNQLLRSGRPYWRLLCGRYLLREVINDTVQPYSQAKAETEVYSWLKSVPDMYSDEFLTESLRDFFTCTKRAHLNLTLLQSEKKLTMTSLLSRFMMMQNVKKSVEES